MNKVELLKSEKDGLDVWPDIVRYAKEGRPVEEIPEGDLQRMKWYGLFHRPQVPGTFMLRLRVTGGRLQSSQVRAIAALAAEFGHGAADFTTRQNVQLRGIVLQDVPTIFARLREAHLSALQTGMDNVRNYVGCPLAGIDGLELLDTTELLACLGRALLGNHEFSNLPRKFNLSLAGCREDCGHAETQDLGFVPATAEIAGRRVAGFNVLAGGALGGTSPRLASPLDVFVEPPGVIPLVLALLRVYRDHGLREVRTKARLKWLLEAWGPARFREVLEEYLGAALLPAGHDERIRVAGDHLGVRPQRQAGVYAVGLHVPVGRITAGQLLQLADIADTYGRGDIRLTTGQNVIIPHVAEGALRELLGHPLLRDLRPDPPPIWRGLVACTGKDYCHYSLIDTKARAVELATELERRGAPVAPGTRIHVSGCIHACGKHHIADVGLQGANVRIDGSVIEAADIFLDGRLGPHGALAHKVADKVPVATLADTIEHLLVERSRARSFESALAAAEVTR